MRSSVQVAALEGPDRDASSSGTGVGRRPSRSMSTSVCCAVTMSASSGADTRRTRTSCSTCRCGHADERLDQVVEPGGREILDSGGAHHELRPTTPERRGAGGTRFERGRSTGGSARNRRPCASVSENQTRVSAEYLNGGRLSVSRPSSGLCSRRQARITPSTSSRFSTIRGSESASRFRRSRGSVLDGRTLKCQSSESIERPSRCETRALGRVALLSSWSLAATSATVC